jgi:hypothetical protein
MAITAQTVAIVFIGQKEQQIRRFHERTVSHLGSFPQTQNP